MGKEMTVSQIEEQNPDAVIVATGSRPMENPVPGRLRPTLRYRRYGISWQGTYPVGEKILFVDENGGHHATATVEMLADQGKKIDMITGDLFIGIELAPLGDLYLTRQRLLQKGVTFTTDVRVEKIERDRVSARNIYTNEPITYENYDTIVPDMGNRVVDDLYHTLKGSVKELHRIGDCVAPRNIGMAIYEGQKVGERL